MAPPKIRGVSLFISDVRGCTTGAQEHGRVLEELGKIRQRFTSPKKPLSGYEKKKCLVKLIYIHLLGYPVDLGHAEAISLLSSTCYSERAAAFLFCSLLLVNGPPGLYPELRSLCVASIKKDLSLNREDFAALALDCASHVADEAAAADLFPLVQAIANPAANATVYIRHKAYSAMLHLFRVLPSLLRSDVWASRLGQALLFEQDLACLLALTNLVLAAVLHSQQQQQERSRWLQVQLSVVNTLARIVSGDVPADAFYHGVPAPWLAIRLLQLLQLFNFPQYLLAPASSSSATGPPSGRPAADASSYATSTATSDDPSGAALFRQQQQAVVLSLNEIIRKIFTQALSDDADAGAGTGSSGGFRSRVSQSFSALRPTALSARFASLRGLRRGSSTPQQKQQQVRGGGRGEGKQQIGRNSSSSPAGGLLQTGGAGGKGGGGGAGAGIAAGNATAGKSSGGSAGGGTLTKKGSSSGAAAQQSAATMRHAVLFEAINLTSSMQTAADAEIKRSAAAVLVTFVAEGKSNVRYKSLGLMTSLAAEPTIQHELRKSLPPILQLLKEEEDGSIRKQATAVAAALSGPVTWSIVVLALLACLREDDEDMLQDEVANKIALLVQAYAPDATWLVDVVFRMMEYSPRYIRDETWMLVVHVVAGTDAKPTTAAASSNTLKPGDVALQRYAARKAVEYLKRRDLHEVFLRVCGYLVGEYGHLIKEEVPARVQLQRLLYHFNRVTAAKNKFPPHAFISVREEPPAVSAVPLLPLLLLALVKVAHTHAGDTHRILQLLQQQQDSEDLELQTRAVELAALLSDRQLTSHTLSAMPSFKMKACLPPAAAGSGSLHPRGAAAYAVGPQPLQRVTLPPLPGAAAALGGGGDPAAAAPCTPEEIRAAAVAQEQLACEIRGAGQEGEAARRRRRSSSSDLAQGLGSLVLRLADDAAKRRNSSSDSEGVEGEEESSTSAADRAASPPAFPGSGSSSSRSRSSRSPSSIRAEGRTGRRRGRDRRRRGSSSSSSRSRSSSGSESSGDEAAAAARRQTRESWTSRAAASSSRRTGRRRRGGGGSTSSSSSSSRPSAAASSPPTSSRSSSERELDAEEKASSDEATGKDAATLKQQQQEMQQATRLRRQQQQQRLLGLVARLSCEEAEQQQQRAAAGGAGGTAAGAAGTTAAGESSSSASSAVLWKRLCICSEGPLLLLRGLLEVYVHRRFVKRDGQLRITFRNVSDSYLLQIHLQPTAAAAAQREVLVKVEEKTESGNSSRDSAFLTVPVRGAAAVFLRVRCMQPFVNSPQWSCEILPRLAAAAANTPSHLPQQPQAVQVTLPLPVMLLNFVEPACDRGLEPQDFVRSWKQLAPQQPPSRNDSSSSSSSRAGEAVALGPLALSPQHVPLYLEAAFNLSTVKVGRTLGGSGVFYTATTRATAAKKKSTGEDAFFEAACMCTVELKPNSSPLLARVTVRAAHPSVAACAAAVLHSYLLVDEGAPGLLPDAASTFVNPASAAAAPSLSLAAALPAGSSSSSFGSVATAPAPAGPPAAAAPAAPFVNVFPTATAGAAPHPPAAAGASLQGAAVGAPPSSLLQQQQLQQQRHQLLQQQQQFQMQQQQRQQLLLLAQQQGLAQHSRPQQSQPLNAAAVPESHNFFAAAPPAAPASAGRRPNPTSSFGSAAVSAAPPTSLSSTFPSQSLF